MKNQPDNRKQMRVFSLKPAGPEHKGKSTPSTRACLLSFRKIPASALAELGRRMGMSAPAVTERVRRLEEQKVIRGYRLELNSGSARAARCCICAHLRAKPGTACEDQPSSAPADRGSGGMSSGNR